MRGAGIGTGLARQRRGWTDDTTADPSDGDSPADYAALAAALDRTGREGVARWVMRYQRYAGALRSDGSYLMLVTLRRAR